MAEERTERRLAAILAADVVGYSRLMEQDELGTIAALKERRRTILTPLVAHYRGRIVKVMGDGVIVEFASAVNAVACAVELQRQMAAANDGSEEPRHILLRVGINLGDVVVEGSDLYGDGVNIAARLEAIAEPGDILVSGTAYDHIKNNIKAEISELGSKSLKNIEAPVRVYRVQSQSSASRQPTAWARKPLPMPDKPSIAVLPFTSMSNDPEQEAFADGLVEDLITDLSRNAELFVIARNSTFAYKGRSVDARLIARDLGVRYLLEGSARRVQGRVRINVQLIDAVAGGHLWAERFDRSLEDIFAVQDEGIGRIVEALVGRLQAPPIRTRRSSLEAYDLCVRARRLTGISPQASNEARMLLERAMSLDPGYAETRRWLAFVLWEGWSNWGARAEADRRRSLELAESAVRLD